MENTIDTHTKDWLKKFEVQILTDKMHLSHVAKGYYILKVRGLYYPFCGSIMLENHGYKEYQDCVNSFLGKL